VPALVARRLLHSSISTISYWQVVYKIHLSLSMTAMIAKIA